MTGHIITKGSGLAQTRQALIFLRESGFKAQSKFVCHVHGEATAGYQASRPPLILGTSPYLSADVRLHHPSVEDPSVGSLGMVASTNASLRALGVERVPVALCC